MVTLFYVDFSSSMMFNGFCRIPETFFYFETKYLCIIVDEGLVHECLGGDKG
jgi:hypothetical protein